MLFLGSQGLTGLRDLVPAATPVRVALIAAAAEGVADPSWVRRDVATLESFGWTVEPVDLDRRTDAESAVQSADVVYVPGGNTYLLLHRLRTTGLDEALTAYVERGGLYAGCSAGAIVAGPDIDLTAEPDQRSAVPAESPTAGLGWVPFAVLPHAGRNSDRFLSHSNRVLGQLAAPIVRITDDEAVVVDGDGWRVVWSPVEQGH